jgi:sulfhydrogenase subunit beta (sulfur reductase)
MKKIAKRDVDAFIASLLKDYTVYAPARVAEYVTFREITAPEEVVWDRLDTRQPPKGVFFPQTEVLFEYEKGTDGVVLRPTENGEGKQVLLAVRPCDVQAIGVLDLVFDTPDNTDVYYVNRRQKTTIVGLGCNHPLSTCFCTSVGGGPFRKEGSDVFLTDIGEAYLVEALTPKGERLLAGAELAEADESDVATARRIEEAALARLAPVVDVKDIEKRLETMIDSPFWDEVQATCLGCGVCTLLCPVCSCFDIVDEGTMSCGVRVRNWDTCQFCIYTLEASGHNPRPSVRERMRQRLMHKFDYYLANEGVLGCVGCGRCVRLCPVNLDIRKLLADIQTA